MIIEARTLYAVDKDRLVLSGWKLLRQEGSEFFLRWPSEAGWPGDPRERKPMACGWRKSNARAHPQDCSNWPQCGCNGPGHNLGRTRAALPAKSAALVGPLGP